MKPHILRSLHALLIPFLLLACAAPPNTKPLAAGSPTPLPAEVELKFPGADDEFIVYYKEWPSNDDAFYKRMGERYKLIILNTGDLVPPEDIKNIPDKVFAYKHGRIKMLRDLGAIVFAYQSIGSENIEDNCTKLQKGDKVDRCAYTDDKRICKPYTGDMHGPCSCTDPAKCCKTGYASYYIDDGKGCPVIQGTAEYVSAAVNAGSLVWRQKMQERAKEQMALGSTGLFLDTLDTATDLEWTRAGTITLLQELNNITPNIIVNRGIRLLEYPEFASAYMKSSWAIMFEDFFTDWKNKQGVPLGLDEQKANAEYWAPMLKDKNVLVIDFASCEQLEKHGDLGDKQKEALHKANVKNGTKWPNYLADINFHEVRYKFKCEQ